MSELSSWSFPTQILFGAGATRTQIGPRLGALGLARALVVTDRQVHELGLIEPVTASLAGAGLAYSVFDEVDPNPVEQNVHAGRLAYVEANADCVIGVGGGSVMDVAKVVALAVNHRRPLIDYDDATGGDRHVTGEVPPIITVPTTAGTGSEVGRSGVVTLAANQRKTVIFAPKLMPKLAVIDPELTRSMPPFITAATGYDALSHCVEALAAKGDHPLADAIALGGVKLIAAALPRAVSDGDDLAARGDMMKAAMMGAVAFQKGLGACHSLAHPLSNLCGLQHGLANALCLPAVVRFNLGAGGDLEQRYGEVARLLGRAPEGAQCAPALLELRARVGLPSGLKAAGVAASLIDELAAAALADSCHALNPRTCTAADLKALYEECF